MHFPGDRLMRVLQDFIIFTVQEKNIAYEPEYKNVKSFAKREKNVAKRTQLSRKTQREDNAVQRKSVQNKTCVSDNDKRSTALLYRASDR